MIDVYINKWWWWQYVGSRSREEDISERYLVDSTGLGVWSDVGEEIDVYKWERERERERGRQKQKDMRFLAWRILFLTWETIKGELGLQWRAWICCVVYGVFGMMEHRCWVGCGLYGFGLRRTVRSRNVDFRISTWMVTGITGRISVRGVRREQAAWGCSQNISSKE